MNVSSVMVTIHIGGLTVRSLLEVDSVSDMAKTTKEN